MKIGIGQLRSTACLKTNGEAAARLIEQAYRSKCRVLFLPEASDYISGSPDETIKLAVPIDESPFFKALRTALKKFPICVSVGVHEPTQPPSSRVRNTLLWVNSKGLIENRYQKLHLFDADVPSGPILRESKSVEPGMSFPELIDFENLKIGPQICYDIRFPETSLELRKRGANTLLYPSAFTIKTGEVHWRVLNQARAIDNQCFVISAAQTGMHDKEGKRQSYGHALAIDPWGRVLCESTSFTEDLLTAQLDLSIIDSVRGNMPLLEQRKSVPMN